MIYGFAKALDIVHFVNNEFVPLAKSLPQFYVVIIAMSPDKKFDEIFFVE